MSAEMRPEDIAAHEAAMRARLRSEGLPVGEPVVIKPEPFRQRTELPCGCVYVALHKTGDRAFICNHNDKWIVTAHPPTEVHFTFKNLGNWEGVS